MNIIQHLIGGLVFGFGLGISSILVLLIFDRLIAWQNEKSKKAYLKEKRKQKQRDKQRNN